MTTTSFNAQIGRAGLHHGGITGIGLRATISLRLTRSGRYALGSEVGHGELTEMHLGETMHERKALMADLSDRLVAAPGGAGTLDEAFEIWMWAQLGINAKPCGLLNTGGYFDSLLVYLKHVVDEVVLKPDHLKMLMVEVEVTCQLDRFADYDSPTGPSCLDTAAGLRRAGAACGNPPPLVGRG